MKKFYDIAKNYLFPINRSLTGQGVVKTLKIIKKEFPLLKIRRFKSGTKVYDWNIPPEWNLYDAYVIDKYNNKIIDFKKNNLHVFGYSIPIKKTLNKKKLFKNFYYLKKKPKAIPYITSYYKRRWGFCLSYNEFKKFNKKYLSTDKFKVLIESSFKHNGSLNYGEIVLKGKSKKEILISTYICHPSMANNELSGTIVSMALINYFYTKKLNKTIRFIFIPETIGSIAYINKNLDYLKKNVLGGFNLTTIGDERQHSCMFSKYKNSPSDEAIIEAYKKLKIKNYKIYSFLERGSDERQYNSPGVDLKISSIFRSKYGDYPEYHTSLDDFNLVTIKGCQGGFEVAKKSIEILQKRIFPENTFNCEPHLSKRGLYSSLSFRGRIITSRDLMNFLQYADGSNSLEKISSIINLNIADVNKINTTLLKHKLIKN